jgi:hypothetical protein
MRESGAYRIARCTKDIATSTRGAAGELAPSRSIETGQNYLVIGGHRVGGARSAPSSGAAPESLWQFFKNSMPAYSLTLFVWLGVRTCAAMNCSLKGPLNAF